MGWQALGGYIARLVVGEVAPGKRGFFTLLREDTSYLDSLDVGVQEMKWEKAFAWTGVSGEEWAGVIRECT